MCETRVARWTHLVRACSNELVSSRSILYTFDINKLLDFQSTLLSICYQFKEFQEQLVGIFISWLRKLAKRWTFTVVHVHSKINWFQGTFCLSKPFCWKQSLPRSMLINVSINITIFFSTFDSHFFSLF